MKFTITLLSFLTAAEFAVAPSRVDLERGATATIQADQETVVSCMVGTSQFKAAGDLVKLF